MWKSIWIGVQCLVPQIANNVTLILFNHVLQVCCLTNTNHVEVGHFVAHHQNANNVCCKQRCAWTAPGVHRSHCAFQLSFFPSLQPFYCTCCFLSSCPHSEHKIGCGHLKCQSPLLFVLKFSPEKFQSAITDWTLSSGNAPQIPKKSHCTNSDSLHI